MNVNVTELNVAMLRKGVNAKGMAEVIKKSRVSFDKKRSGTVQFELNEVQAISKALDLTLQQVNVIFFDSTLHDGNYTNENVAQV